MPSGVAPLVFCASSHLNVNAPLRSWEDGSAGVLGEPRELGAYPGRQQLLPTYQPFVLRHNSQHAASVVIPVNSQFSFSEQVVRSPPLKSVLGMVVPQYLGGTLSLILA